MFGYTIPYGVATLGLMSCDSTSEALPFVNVVDGQYVA